MPPPLVVPPPLAPLAAPRVPTVEEQALDALMMKYAIRRYTVWARLTFSKRLDDGGAWPLVATWAQAVRTRMPGTALVIGMHIDTDRLHLHPLIYVPRQWQNIALLDQSDLFARYYRELLAWRQGPVNMQPYRPGTFGRTAALGYLARCGIEYVRPFGAAPALSHWDETR